MNEVIHASFQAINIVPTILLMLVGIYWLTVMLGALDLGFLDFDLDADFESDVELEVEVGADTDVDAGAEVDGGASSMDKILSFLNLGRVPFMVFMTCFSLPLWTCSVLITHYLGIEHVGLAIALLIPYSIVSAFCAKFLTAPFAGMFERMEKDEMHNFDLVGKVCTTKWEVSSKKTSQAEIKFEGSVFIVNVKTDGETIIPKGDKGLVIQFRAKQNYFIVEPYNDLA